MSGLATAIALRRAGRTTDRDFVVLEQSSGLGGTWWDTRYPGAHVDVPAPLYSLSHSPNPLWSRRFAAAAEIQAYMQQCAQRHGVLPHLRLGTRLVSAHFDGASARWHLQAADGRRWRARHFVCSTGPLSQPRWPDIPGLQDFAGTLLHSARWPADGLAQAAGRRVGVIGSGSTASQLVPPLAATAAQMTLFQRTANWVLPRPDRRYGAIDRLLAQMPPYSRAVRAFWYHVLEWGRNGFDEGTLARRGMLRAAERHLRRQISDPVLRERLRPPYPLGCKRIIYSSDFYPALTRPNAALLTDRIETVTPQGLRTVAADGRSTEHALDLLVCATGFDTQHLLAGLDLRGAGGTTLAEAWRDGPSALHGMTVAGFPNLYLLLGPNTGTGHTSTLLYIEPQVQHVLDCLGELKRRDARWLAPRADAQAAQDAVLQARLAGSVWSQCRSWYRHENGRITALWPGRTGEYVQALRASRWQDYVFG